MTTVTLKSRNVIDLLLIFLFSVMLVSPIVFLGIPDNFDLPQHLRFARTFNDSLSEMSITPEWESRDNFGFGSVGVRFYPPLLYVSTTFFHLITGNWYDTLWLTILFWMIISCIGVYWLTKEWLSTKYALLAAIIYAVAPYHLTQVYQAFLLAEFAASAILPFCFLFAYRVMRDGGLNNAVFFTASFSLLILSHIASTMIGTISLGIFCLILLEKKNFFRTLKYFTISFVITIATCGFYLARLFTEVEWVKHNSEKFYGSGFYDYTIYFFPLYISGGDKYVERLLWAYDLIIITSLFFLIPVLLMAIHRLMPKWKDARFLYALLITAAFSVFMLSLPAIVVWDNIKLLQKIQFPWRWLSVLTLISSVIFVYGIYTLQISGKLLTRSSSYIIAISLMLLLVFDLTQLIIPSAAVPRDEFDKKVAILDSEAACDCWWPIWAKDEAMEDKRQLSANGRSFEIIEWSDVSRRFRISAGNHGNARIATFFYPYWKASVNGQNVEVAKDENGTILIPLPVEYADVHLYFEEPAFIHTAKFLSAAVWMILFALLVFLFIRQRRANELLDA